MELCLDAPTGASAHICCVGIGWFPKTPGGLDRYVYELAHHLAAGRDRVELCALDLPEAEPNSAVELINLAAAASPLALRLLSIRRSFLHKRAVKPDAINLHFALYNLPLLDILPEDVPITFTFHGPWALESQQEKASKLSVLLKYCLERRVYRSCDRFIVLSKAFGNILNQKYRVDESKIHVIPGGVDLARFQPNLSRQQARAQLNWPQDRIILFTPRRLVQRMGLDKLLTAIAQIKPRIPDVWLAIAGLGPQQSALKQQATELGLNDQVRFLGFLPDDQLPLAYQAADLSVMPSQNLEGFGLTLLESLACGTPVLCTPVGGMPEVLAPFSPDLITSSHQTAAIAERLEELLTGQVQMPSRTACREYTCLHFDWHKIAQQVRQVLLA
ncbi:MAG: glycosyltransferase family 4 protein [Chroococcidiopsidaceae cyanobacterium CP_BM_ER_R8_30]|nr:glycosyltransferase family 4 protein [Chroococcidiopsidaceae cyanobacterium CP_BM_ER_R8_30]